MGALIRNDCGARIGPVSDKLLRNLEALGAIPTHREET